jgi:hypothetical protein
MGEDEKQIPAWIQDHISKAENYISQASSNYHEYGQNEATINEDSETKRLEMLIKNLEETNKLLVQQLKDTKSLPSNKKENIKKSIALNLDLINYYKKWLKDYQAAANESVNEASPCWKGYKQVGMKDKGGRQVPNCVPNESVVNEAPNTGERIQNLNNRIKALRDKLSATKSPEQKKLFQDRLKNALQTLSNIKKDFGIKKEISNKTPKIFVKTAAVEKKIRELMADRKKAVVPYNTEKDPAKKEKLKQILIKLTQQIQGYEKNLIQLRDMEEEYLQQMHADAELDTTGL